MSPKNNFDLPWSVAFEKSLELDQYYFVTRSTGVTPMQHNSVLTESLHQEPETTPFKLSKKEVSKITNIDDDQKLRITERIAQRVNVS